MKQLIIFAMALAVLAIACGQSTDQIGTLVPPTEGPTTTFKPGETRVPTDTMPPTETPIPSATPTPRIEGLIEPGMYLVGTDAGKIAPGVYEGKGESCYWERLSGLGGSLDEIIANDGPDGQFYVEVKETDLAFSIDRCSILPLDKVPAPAEFMTHIEPGIYLVGRDIQAGLYQGNGESCYWERLENVAGELDGIIANDLIEGSFFVQIAPTDYAFRIDRCSVDLAK
jgi:hypothetical protein